jgi:hypothetical protein
MKVFAYLQIGGVLLTQELQQRTLRVLSGSLVDRAAREVCPARCLSKRVGSGEKLVFMFLFAERSIEWGDNPVVEV